MTSRALADFLRLTNGAGYAWLEESKNAEADEAPVEEKKLSPQGRANMRYLKRMQKKLAKKLRGGPFQGHKPKAKKEETELSLGAQIRKIVRA